MASAVLLIIAACSEPHEAPPGGLHGDVPEADGMNLLVISFDALRADRLPIHGHPVDTAPHLSKLAERSVVFERYLSAAQATPTSFASAWTGMLPFRVFRGWQQRDEETLAQLFTDHGFHTFLVASNIQLLPERGFAQGFATYRLLDKADDEGLLEEAVRELQAAGDQQPFFGWVHFISPHTPYERKPGSEAFYEDMPTKGRYFERVPGQFDIESDAELQQALALYDGEIFYADGVLARLLAALERQGLRDNTIIVVTSDHGEEFMDHGQVQHNNVYDEVLRVPMIVHHPAMSDGIRYDAPASNVDLYPTLADWFGFDDDKRTDGISHFRRQPEGRAVIGMAMTNQVDRQVSIERNGEKLHITCAPEFQERLFDLRADPGELQDLILDRPARAGELFDALSLITGGDPCEAMRTAAAGKTVDSNLTEEQLEQLRSLGYIQ